MDKEKINELILDNSGKDIITGARVYQPSNFITICLICFLMFLIGMVMLMVKPSPLFHLSSHANPDISYSSFKNKVGVPKKKTLFTASEVASFLDIILVKKVFLNSKQEVIFAFPDKVHVGFQKKDMIVFLPVKFFQYRLTVGMKIHLNMYKRRRLRVRFKRLFFGRLMIPGVVADGILKFFNVELVYPIPSFIQDIYVENGALVLLRKKYKQSAKGKNQEKVNNGKQMQAEAEKLHMLGDYFMSKNLFDSALIQYEKVIHEYPSYIHIDDVNRKIKQIKGYQNG